MDYRSAAEFAAGDEGAVGWAAGGVAGGNGRGGDGRS